MRRLLLTLCLSLAACAAPAPAWLPGLSPRSQAPMVASLGSVGISLSLDAQELPEWIGDGFYRSLVALGNRAPLDAPVVIEVLELEGRWGTASWSEGEGRYRIRLDTAIPGPGVDWAVDVLVHEWAHCLVLGAASQEDDHGPLWGVALARCYRAAVDPGWASPEPGAQQEGSQEPAAPPAAALPCL